MKRKVALTGIKPSGTPHLGNYLGAIRPALELAREHLGIYFIADYHALTSVSIGAEVRQLSYEVACSWLALGLDPESALFYRQSEVPELTELAWILACQTPKGLLNRAHAYKAAVDKNIEEGRAADDEVNAGLYGYPVLMAADILLFRADVVPVGQDQKQHLEITREIARNFNRTYGEILTVPEPRIDPQTMVLPGTDGRKMSKSYGNTIPIFGPPKAIRKRVMQIQTDSARPEDPKDPDTSNLFAIYRQFAPPERAALRRRQFLEGGLGYAELKSELADTLDSLFGEARARYDALISDGDRIDRILSEGARRARALAGPLMAEIRSAVGVGRGPA